MLHRAEFALFKLIQVVLLLLPLRSVQRLGRVLGSIAYVCASGRRGVALENLRHAYPERSEAERRSIAKEAFASYGTTLLEFFWFPNVTERTIDALFRESDFAVMRKVRESGRGALYLTGHLGNWELLAAASARFSGMQFAIIVQTQSNAYFDEEINRYRSKFGNRTVPMGISVREIIRTLQEKGVVAVAGDQSGAKEAVYVDFFGRSVATHQGPAVFALKCKAPLYLGVSTRRPDGSYDVQFTEVPSEDLRVYSEENVIELTRRHTAMLEENIRRHPGQWLWMHRRWKNTLESVRQEGTVSSEAGT